jgi:hypothetical protein
VFQEPSSIHRFTVFTADFSALLIYQSLLVTPNSLNMTELAPFHFAGPSGFAPLLASTQINLCAQFTFQALPMSAIPGPIPAGPSQAWLLSSDINLMAHLHSRCDQQDPALIPLPMTSDTDLVHPPTIAKAVSGSAASRTAEGMFRPSHQ